MALAEFVAALRIDDVPPVVQHEAKRALVDHLGCALGGSSDVAHGKLRRTADRLAGAGPARVVGHSMRTSPPYAALLNGFAAHILDFDDTFNPGPTTIHGSASVWPVVLSMSSLQLLSGAAALTAFVAGFESETRVALAAGATHYDRGWHVTGTAGHIGAAAAGANALGLSTTGAVNAIGTAATQAAGLKVVYGSDSKPLHPAKSAMDGVLSAVAADEGFTSSPQALEGHQGLLQLMSGDADAALLSAGLGTDWNLLSTGYKSYPSGSLIHPTIDGVLQLRSQHGFTAVDVASVKTQVHPYAASVTGNRTPVSPNEAKFSLPHCVAVAVLSGGLTMADFTTGRVMDPDVVLLRDLVDFTADLSVGKRQANVQVELVDGRTLTAQVSANRGTPDMPLSDNDLVAKFLGLAAPVLGEAHARDLADLCFNLEEVEDFDHVARAATPTRP